MFDGTLLTHGHSYQIGVGCVIDILTGYVVDYEVMPKHCTECANAEFDFVKIAAEYNEVHEK